MAADCSRDRAQDGHERGSRYRDPHGGRRRLPGTERATEDRSDPTEDTDPLDELMRIVSETPARPPYRIRFVGGRPERGTSILKEVRLKASDPSGPSGRRPACPGLLTRSASD